MQLFTWLWKGIDNAALTPTCPVLYYDIIHTPRLQPKPTYLDVIGPQALAHESIPIR